MQKTHLYILQALSILLLICGYFLSDQPDSWSVMHFDLTQKNVIAPVGDQNSSGSGVFVTTASEQSSSKRMNVIKNISYEVIIPKPLYVLHAPYAPIGKTKYIIPNNDRYYYLFYKEINPPPPKASLV